MKLRDNVPKVNGTGGHREVPVQTTYERIVQHMRRVGITRLADITGLDRIGIPVYNAICPASNDMISVYNGKGATPLDAKTSAIMEAVERFAAALPLAPATIASYPELAEAGRAALDPRDVNLEFYEHFDIEMPISWVRGQDLLNETSVLVPMYLAGYYMKFHEVPCYPLGTTNGIASGNSLEEAICHALCELIERDDWTMADLIGNRLRRVLSEGAIGAAESAAVAQWLHERHPNVDISTLSESAADFVEKFHAAGLTVDLKNVTSETGIATVLAVVSEDVAPTFSQSHMGLGAHPDAEVAVCRALTEVAQSRVVDINAVREDITLPGEKVQKYFFHVKRSGAVNKDAWAFKRSESTIRMRDLPNHPSVDVMEDTRLMLERLRARGMNQAIAVDLSAPEIPAKVVRVIVPGIESWIIDRSKLGPRAAAEWNGTLKEIRRACELASAARN
jgi:ribosomal protein S12 methylthiotransferase accessory factor